MSFDDPNEIKEFIKLSKLNSEIDYYLKNTLKLSPENIYVDIYQVFVNNDLKNLCRLVKLNMQ